MIGPEDQDDPLPSALGPRDGTPFPVLPIRGTEDTRKGDPVSASEPQKRLGVALIYERDPTPGLPQNISLPPGANRIDPRRRR